MDRRTLLAENIAEATRFAELLSSNPSVIVINPAAFSPTLGNWSQDDYNSFWIWFLGQFVDEVVMRDGWEHSTGCTLEFEAAHRLELPVRDQNGQSLSLRDGLRLIDRRDNPFATRQTPRAKASVNRMRSERAAHTV